MEGYLKKIYLFVVILMFLVSGCGKKEETKLLEKPLEEIKCFTLKQFTEDKAGFVLAGEKAEVLSGEASISTPRLSLSTANEFIEITTGKEGTAEISIDPEKKKIKSITIKGNIKIINRDIKTQQITMEGSCKELIYNENEKIITMEVSPVVKRGNDFFSGDVMYYNLEKNSLEIKGNVNARIYTEKGSD